MAAVPTAAASLNADISFAKHTCSSRLRPEELMFYASRIELSSLCQPGLSVFRGASLSLLCICANKYLMPLITQCF